ncbi:MAG TPA: Ig-like domain-containing protein [Algoriphagus sp.]|nr:Ig-like domain-containing protein [Algoriphagus sp.]
MAISRNFGGAGWCFVLVSACIGTDFQNDPTVDPLIELESQQIGLKINDQLQLSPRYFNEYGQEEQVSFSYSSSNPALVEVNSTGLVTAKSPGTGFVQVWYGEKVMNSLQINVVSDPNEVAIVLLNAERRTLFPGQQTQMEVSIQNLIGQNLTGKTIQWFSENETIATVDQNGLVTAMKFGKTDIHAKVSGVKSNPITVSVAVQQLSGTFVPAGGYRASGMAFFNQENEKLVLRFSQDFETSFALGTFVYLANSTNGQEIRASGLEIAEIRTNGPHTFDISARHPEVQITDYKYVIIFCKPAGVTFGFAEMRN